MQRAEKIALQRGSALLFLVLVATACASSAQITTQNLQADDRPSTIRGTVVNSVTGAPLARALVLFAVNNHAMLTDGEGHFEFPLPEGAGESVSATFGKPSRLNTAVLSARKPGFLDDPNGGSPAELTSGSEITIRLLPEALIKGRVVFSETDPAMGIVVQLYSRQVQEGIYRWTQAGTATANSNGEFRFAELLPGSYKLATAEWMDNDPAAAIPGGQQYGFPPVYYPAVADFAEAGTIQVTGGQTVQADIPLARQPYYPVKIPVADADANTNLNVTVSVQGHRGPGYSLGYNAQHQQIEGLLPAGNYLVEASTIGQTSFHGSVQLSVAGAPADGPRLTLGPNSSINVHVVEEFTSNDAQASSVWNLGSRSIRVRGPRLYLQISAEAADDFVPPGNGALRLPTGANDDSLVLENLTPGRYWLRLHSSRGYVASATMGGVDVLHEPFAVAAGSSTPIEITMRDDSAELDGTVAGIATQPALGGVAGPSRFSPPQVWVYCMPLPDSAGQFEQIWVSPDGKFNAPTMAPGTYHIVAFRNQQPNLPYRDAEAMRAYESRGQVVHLAAGQKVNVELQPVSSSE